MRCKASACATASLAGKIRPSHSVLDHEGNAARVGADDRDAGRHRLEHDGRQGMATDGTQTICADRSVPQFQAGHGWDELNDLIKSQLADLCNQSTRQGS